MSLSSEASGFKFQVLVSSGFLAHLLKGQGERMASDSRVLGGGDFVEGILREADRRVKRYLPEREKEGLIERIAEEMCRKEGISVEEMRMGGQRQAVSRVRGKIAWVLSRGYGISLAEIGRRVGVCTSAIG
jgi:putative transposase